MKTLRFWRTECVISSCFQVPAVTYFTVTAPKWLCDSICVSPGFAHHPSCLCSHPLLPHPKQPCPRWDHHLLPRLFGPSVLQTILLRVGLLLSAVFKFAQVASPSTELTPNSWRPASPPASTLRPLDLCRFWWDVWNTHICLQSAWVPVDRGPGADSPGIHTPSPGTLRFSHF